MSTEASERFIDHVEVGFDGDHMPTHGSLTKAGKVRAQTPKVEGIKRKSHNPRKRNRSNYVKRVLAAPPERFPRRRRRR